MQGVQQAQPSYTHKLARMPQLAAARYGKDNVRVYKVERDEASKTHTVIEMTVCVLLEGEIETS
jgi:urate oxidase